MDFKKIINAALKFLEGEIFKAASKVVKSVDGLKGTIEVNSEAERREMSRFGNHLKTLSDKLQNPKFDINVDMDEVVSELRGMNNILLHINQKEVNFSTIEQLLVRLIETFKQGHPDAFAEKIDALDAVFKGIKIPDTIGFDKQQMKGLMTALTSLGGGIITGGGVLGVRNMTVMNVSIPTANTPVEFKFPANTVQYQLRMRQTDVPLLVASETGKLPTSGDGSAYFTVFAYFEEKTSGLDMSGKKLYFQTDQISQICEVIVYTA